jgi:hypothetical protein
MRWIRSNAGWLGVVATLGSGLVALYARATLADTKTRIAVLEAQRVEDAKAIEEIKSKVSQIHQWMWEDRNP